MNEEGPMDIQQFYDFFFWCLIINAGIYLLVAIAWMAFRNFYTRILTKTLAVDEATIANGVFTYLGNYKLLITIFNFTPWLALLIIK